jgi:uncharacterized protein with PIN domain
MQQVMPCPKCKAELRPTMQGMPPQIVNGLNISVAAMVNVHVECTACGTKFHSQMMGVQFQMGFVETPPEKEEPRIIVPDMIPPGLKRIK